jgi:DNA replication protein DnaC
MEHIKAILGNLENRRITPTPKNIENELVGDALELLRRDMNITSFENTFENFKALAGTESAVKAMKKFTETQQPPLILLFGGVGSGKTFLLEAVAIAWRKQGIFSRVIKYEKLLSALRRSMEPRAIPDYETILNNFCQAGRLLLDDYGMGTKDTEWAKSILEAIIDHRYHESLPTVVATNKDITEIPARVYSRFSEKGRGLVVLNRGKDYRQK